MSQNNTSQATALDFEIPSFYNTYNLNSYGGLKIAVYKSRGSLSYFYTPLILVDWNDYKIALSLLDKENENLIQEISILIQHSDRKVEDEIISNILIAENNKLKAEEKIASSSIALNLLPYKFYKIYAKLSEKKIWLNEDDISNLSPEDNFTTQLTLVHERAYILKGTYAELEYFYKSRRTNLIWANLYSDGTPYSTTTVSAIATFFNDSRNSTKIFGDEDIIRKNIVSSSSSGGGFGISAGPISIGGGTTTSSVTSEKQIKRYFNRTFISNVLSNSKSEINLVVDGDITKYTELIKQFVDKLFENKNKIVADIEKDSDNTFKLINDQINNVTVTDSGSILSAKPQIDKNDDNDVEFKYGGISGSSKTKNKFKTQDDITWEIKEGEPIPVKVDLYLLNESQLKDEFSSLAILFNREAKKNTITPFIYPAVFLARNPDYTQSLLTDKDNPIGSILAFAGVKENRPDGWEICNGDIKKVADYPTLFRIIDYRWGKGADDTEFKLPNLQGQFLRGIDYDKNTDPDVNTRANFLNEIGEVGSYQGFDIQSHNHGYYKADTSDGPSGSGAVNPVRKDFSLQATASSGGKETRPINAYVNFIIRVK